MKPQQRSKLRSSWLWIWLEQQVEQRGMTLALAYLVGRATGRHYALPVLGEQARMKCIFALARAARGPDRERFLEAMSRGVEKTNAALKRKQRRTAERNGRP